MTDRQFFDPNTCLVTSINATSIKLSGIAKDLAETYPHGNLFEDRKQLYTLNRSVSSDRPCVGTIVAHEPPPKSNYPHIVGLVTQFGPGEYVENNSTAKYYVENSRDMHYVNGLMSDTKENRRENFNKCLLHLADYALMNTSIKKIVFPEGLGRRGKVDKEWRLFYLAELKNLVRRLESSNIEIMLAQPNVSLEDSAYTPNAPGGSCMEDLRSRSRL